MLAWLAPFFVLSTHYCAEAELQRNLLQEKARATSLEVQVRALCLELNNSKEQAGDALQACSTPQVPFNEQFSMVCSDIVCEHKVACFSQACCALTGAVPFIDMHLAYIWSGIFVFPTIPHYCLSDSMFPDPESGQWKNAHVT